MSSRRSPATPVAAPAAGWPPLALDAGRRRGRLGRTGSVGLAVFVVWMVAGRMVLADGAARPAVLLVGWDVVLDLLELRGHALGAFRLALAGLWVALPLSALTGGFRHGPGWLPLASGAVGLAGLAAAVPVLLAAAVLALNVILWGMAVMLGLLLLTALLLRVVTAPFRRW